MGKKISFKKINIKKEEFASKNSLKTKTFSASKFSKINIFQQTFFSRLNVFILLTSFIFQGLYLNKVAIASSDLENDEEEINFDVPVEKENYSLLDVVTNMETVEDSSHNSEDNKETSTPEEDLNTDIALIGEKNGDEVLNNRNEKKSDDLLEVSSEEGTEVVPEDGGDEQKVLNDDSDIVIQEEEEVTLNDNLGNDSNSTEKSPENNENVDIEESTEETNDLDNFTEKTDRITRINNSKNENGEDLDNNTEEEYSKSDTEKFTSSVERTNGLSFSGDECVTVSDGSFYCNKRVEKKADNALFSAPDKDGDLEIFLVRDGKQVQITHNNTDDASPYFDNISNTIVWHRLINDRYQIVSFDLKTNKESILTSGSVNNMEPTRQGDYTVWQRWTGESWNIILLFDDEEINLTNDINNHNLTPRIQGNLVIWNHHTNSGEKKVGIYDLEAKSLIIIDDPEGITVDNPRVVLMYDSLYPNGDIVTKGYDLISNKFIDIDSLPINLPDIPRSEEVKETKALTQTKLEHDAIVENNNLPNVSGGGDGDDDSEKTQTTTENVSEEENSESLDVSTEDEEKLADESFTLDLSENNLSDKDSSNLNNDYDLIIPEFSKDDEISV